MDKDGKNVRNVCIRGLVGKIWADINIFEEDFPHLASSKELGRLCDLMLESILNFEGCVIVNDWDLPVEFSEKYREARCVVPEEDIILFSDDI